MRAHFQVCDFAVFKCPIAGCTWTGPKREIDGHLTNNPHTQFLGPVLLDLVAKQNQIQDNLSTVSSNLDSINVRLTNMNSTWNSTHQTVIAIEQQLKAPEASERSVRRWKQTIRERDARIMNLESELRAIKSARVERCRDEDAS
jgi:septal ring factor EnvC (AmiA/AmiB activator)